MKSNVDMKKNIYKVLDPPVPTSMELQEKFLLPMEEFLRCRKWTLSPPDANNSDEDLKMLCPGSHIQWICPIPHVFKNCHFPFAFTH
jgi:hypothetical protein